MKASILNALRKSTDLLVRFDTRTIELVPHQRTKKPGGVYDNETQPPRPPQEFYIEPSASALGGITGTAGGAVGSEGAQVHSWPYFLVGAWDCQMEINDTWKEGDTTYRIIAIQPFNNYERRGVIEAIGKDPSYGA